MRRVDYFTYKNCNEKSTSRHTLRMYPKKVDSSFCLDIFHNCEMYSVGIDPGSKNGGMNVMNNETGYSDLLKINFRRYLSSAKDITNEDDLPELPHNEILDQVTDFIHDYHEEYFQHTTNFTIEKQIFPYDPRHNVRGDVVVYIISRALYSGLAAAYPKAEVRWGSAKAMRNSFGITVTTKNHPIETESGKYKLRKDLSEGTLPEILADPADIKRVYDTFTVHTPYLTEKKKIPKIKTEFFRDPIDATLHVLFAQRTKKKKRQRVTAKHLFPTLKKVRLTKNE